MAKYRESRFQCGNCGIEIIASDECDPDNILCYVCSGGAASAGGDEIVPDFADVLESKRINGDVSAYPVHTIPQKGGVAYVGMDDEHALISGTDCYVVKDNVATVKGMGVIVYSPAESEDDYDYWFIPNSEWEEV